MNGPYFTKASCFIPEFPIPIFREEILAGFVLVMLHCEDITSKSLHFRVMTCFKVRVRVRMI